jgi:hypothetical protein
MFSVSEQEGSVTFRVRVQPRASRTELAGEHDGAIKLRLAAPPVDGKANEECRRFLAKLVRVPLSSVQILAGESSRDKVIRVYGVSAERVREALMK